VFAPGVVAASGGKSMVKYEGGYTVETVFDGSKLGIEPYSVEVTQGGELLVMDSMNSNIYRMALPLSRCECVLADLFLLAPPESGMFWCYSPVGLSANYMLLCVWWSWCCRSCGLVGAINSGMVILLMAMSLLAWQPAQGYVMLFSCFQCVCSLVEMWSEKKGVNPIYATFMVIIYAMVSNFVNVLL